MMQHRRVRIELVLDAKELRTTEEFLPYVAIHLQSLAEHPHGNEIVTEHADIVLDQEGVRPVASKLPDGHWRQPRKPRKLAHLPRHPMVACVGRLARSSRDNAPGRGLLVRSDEA